MSGCLALLLQLLHLDEVVARRDGLRRRLHFFVDPVAFLASLPGAEIGHVVLVPPARADSVAAGTDEPPPNDTLPGLAADLEKGPSDYDADYSDTPFQGNVSPCPVLTS